MIEGLETLTRTDLDVLLAFAKYDMRVNRTSEKAFFHRNTIDSHLSKIRYKTGLNPKKFYDLVKLIAAVEEMEKNGSFPR